MSCSHHSRTDVAAESAGRLAPPVNSVSFSVILPAYNEAQRLPAFLQSVRPYCRQQYGDDYEVIVVDDGSSDGTAEQMEVWSQQWPQLQLLRLAEHRGKGAAVRAGMLSARGRLLLFADADGATPIDEAIRLHAEIERGADLAIGSRLLTGDGVQQDRTWSRRLLGRTFARVTHALLRLSVRDTQCGFKMFRRDAGRCLFSLLREEGFLFDLELLILADQQGYRVVEVPVNWTEKPGGSFHWPREFWRVARGLRRLHGRHGNPTHRQSVAARQSAGDAPTTLAVRDNTPSTPPTARGHGPTEGGHPG